MSGQQLTHSEHALQRVVESLADLLYHLVKAGLTHTYQDVFRFCELKTIGYLVLRYRHTGAVPFKEWAEEWLHDGEV
jgi:hypothetical protein